MPHFNCSTDFGRRVHERRGTRRGLWGDRALVRGKFSMTRSASTYGNEGVGAKRGLRPLEALNFFMADMQAGIGPFLGVFLLAHHWESGLIGTVMTLGGVAGMIMTAPAGALIDATSRKRLFVIIPGICTVLASAIILLSQEFWLVAASQIATAIAGAAIGPRRAHDGRRWRDRSGRCAAPAAATGCGPRLSPRAGCSRRHPRPGSPRFYAFPPWRTLWASLRIARKP